MLRSGLALERLVFRAGDFRVFAVLLLGELPPVFFFLVAVAVRDFDFTELRDRLVVLRERLPDVRLALPFFPAVEREVRLVDFLFFVAISPSSVSEPSMIR